VKIYFSTGMASGYIFSFGDDSGYIFWMTRGVWSPGFKRKKHVIFSLLGVFLAFFPLFIDAVLGYRRPAACNTELRVLLIVVYNVGYCF
jgi:heme/copper-type cytochrome/quinol oxidase subunit 1